MKKGLIFTLLLALGHLALAENSQVIVQYKNLVDQSNQGKCTVVIKANEIGVITANEFLISNGEMQNVSPGYQNFYDPEHRRSIYIDTTVSGQIDVTVLTPTLLVRLVDDLLGGAIPGEQWEQISHCKGTIPQ